MPTTTTTEHVPAEVFLERGDVTVFHVYWHDDFDQGPEGDLYCTHENGSYENAHGENGVFDVRRLPEPPIGPKLSDHPPYIGMDAARALGFDAREAWKESAEYARRKALWEAWHESGQRAAIENTIHHAIDIGILTADGIKLPEVA